MEKETKKSRRQKAKELLPGETAEFFGGFKKFITRGNVIDLAVAVVIGGAFNKIVSSLVNDIIMPLVTIWIKADAFTDLVWVVRGSTIKYGNFIQMIVEFLIIAFSIYVTVEWFLRSRQRREAKEAALAAEAAKKAKATEPEKLSKSESLLTEIRDLLKEDANLIDKLIDTDRM